MGDKAFSFDNVFDKSLSASLVSIKTDKSIVDTVKTIKEHKDVEFAATKQLYRGLLESIDSAEVKDVYDKFYNSMTALNATSITKYNRIIKTTLNSVVTVDRDLLFKSSECLEGLNPSDSIALPFVKYIIDYSIFDSSFKIVSNLRKIFNDRLRLGEKEDVKKTLDYLVQNYVEIVNKCKNEICGYDTLDEFLLDSQEEMNFAAYEDIVDAFEFIDEFDENKSEVFRFLDRGQKEFNTFLREVSQAKYTVSKNNYKPAMVEEFGKIERIFTSIINEVTLYQSMVLSSISRMMVLKYNQSVAILRELCYAAGEVDVAVSESVESISKKHFMNYDRLVKGSDFHDRLIDVKLNENILECCMQEAIAIASGVNVDQKIQAIHEGFWQKTVDFFNKTWEYIKSVFTKVESWMDKFFKSNKEYIEKYKDQIDKPTHSSINSVEFYEYERALPRMQAVHVPDFDKYLRDESISKDTNIEDEVEKAKKEILKEGRPFEKDEDWKEYCQEYFRGSKEFKTYSGSELSMRTLADRVLSMEKVIDNIKKERSSLDAAFSKVIAAIQRDGKAKDAAKQEEEKKTVTVGAGAEKAAVTQTSVTPPGQNTMANEFALDLVWKQDNMFLYSPLLEEGQSKPVINTVSTSSSNTPGAKNAQIDRAANTGAKTATSVSNATPDDEAGNGALDAKRNLLTKLAGVYSNLYQVKYQTAEEMISGYMKVIKTDVSAYIKVGTNKEG